MSSSNSKPNLSWRQRWTMRHSTWLTTAAVGIAVIGCGSGKPEAGGATVACAPGELGCQCGADVSCGTGLKCAEGTCVESQCDDGALGCACNKDGTCDDSLTCSAEKLCVAVSCTKGTKRCGCKEDQTCAATGEVGETLTCVEGVCVTAACEAGTMGCPCSSGSTCSDTKLFCSSAGLCVTATCPEGTLGCACFSDGACATTAKGVALTCVAATCTDCSNQRCVTRGLSTPEDPSCYTPCKNGFTDAAGAYHECPPDRLMKHAPGSPCLDGKICKQGSCVEEGGSVPACASDYECPDFQNCVQGACYAVCDTDRDCPTGLGCHQHACRTPCSSENQSCVDHTACVITDGQDGYCMPVGTPPSGPSEGVVVGTFQVSAEHIEFNSTHVDETFTITNSGPVGATFKIKKLEHTENGGTNRVTTNSMPWLKLGEPGSEALTNEFSIVVDANSPRTISLKGAATKTISRWQGMIEVRSEDARLGARRINLSYVGSANGRWAGKMLYFANFATKNLDAWVSERNNLDKLQVVGNALVRRWGDFRRGQVTRANFEAALQSAVNGSWKWSTVKKDCPTQACYPYADAANPSGTGLQEFSNSLSVYPVPTDVSELPIAFDLKTSSTDPKILSGRIPTSEALQYPGDPAVTLSFTADPTASTCATSIGGECVTFANALAATINVGGRYGVSGFATTCPEKWQTNNTPWLVPGFLAWTGVNPDNGLLYRGECRDKTQPGGEVADAIPVNTALAGGNPIPDGQTRSRRLELVDGAMINQDSMILIVRERFDSFLGSGDQTQFAAYGVVTLKREPAQLDAAAFEGHAAPAVQTPPAAAARPLQCSAEILKKLGSSGSVSQDNAAAIVTGLLEGTMVATSNVTALNQSQVHYLCHKTGRIDGGDPACSKGASFDCPADSNVTYFYFPNAANMPSASEIAALPCQHPKTCQDNGACQETIDAWRSSKAWEIAALAPQYRCAERNQVFCDSNRGNLRDGKEFYVPGVGGLAFTPLRTAINDAFRYKTQFRSRKDGSIGFAPEPCVANSNAVPYCYDASQIEEARDRVDCALGLYRSFGSALDAATKAALVEYLKTNFAYTQTINPPVFTYDGFETLYTELLVMLGDEAYTSAFNARFDLAGSNHLSFQGSLFEPSGIDLSGAAGYELYKLYQAAQYYGLVLERLYQLAPYMTTATGAFESFVTAPTFTWYFPKLVRASAQRTRAWSEVAKRYQSFNRPELARRVVERAYTSAYLESVVIGNLVTRYLPSASTERADVEKARGVAALTYSAALYDMRDVYQKIADDVTYFGFAPDYIPFPALEATDSNAFTKLLALTRQRVAVAAEKEAAAIGSNRSYETDAASFQSELVKLRINYDNQLAEICGTFTGDDGAVYPASSQYAYLSAKTSALGDPCGFVGTGRLHGSMGQLESIQLDMQGVLQQYDTLFAEIEIERKRVQDQCGIIVSLADAGYKTAGEAASLQDGINAAQLGKNAISHTLQVLDTVRQSMACIVGTSSDCPGKAAAQGFYIAASTGLRLADLALDSQIYDKQAQIAKIEASQVRLEKLGQCDLAKVDSEAIIKQKWLGLENIDLDGLKTQYRLRLAASEIQQYHDQAKRIANEMQEMEEQTVNVEAARNDPNVRIYKNDAIVNADRAFSSAIAAAYQATKVYEYYTSESYGRLNQLFLVRMVNAGDYNLANYVTELEDAYLGFQQQYGNPDERVDILSLRDDVFQIPRLGDQGQAMSQAERIAQFRLKLKDVALLDEQGYLTVPFSTSVARLSPLTRNHKIHRLEVEIVGSDVGDSLGRIYVRQKGTGVVRAVGGDSLYYRFPELTAVADPFFNGVRAFGAEVYGNDRLRDRPFINSRWDLVINQKDELANQDINLDSVTDVRLYVYYTDFTAR